MIVVAKIVVLNIKFKIYEKEKFNWFVIGWVGICWVYFS